MPNKGRDPLVVEMRVKSGFEADKSQFVGIWKILGEDIGCEPLDPSANEDGAVYLCDKDEIYSDMMFNSPARQVSTFTSSWSKTYRSSGLF